MDAKLISEQLRALAASDKNRSTTARLRDVIEDVELALAAGVSRKAIVEQLAKNGLVMTLTVFDNALYRIRKKRGKQTRPKNQTAPLATTPKSITTPLAEEPNTEELPLMGSHDPRDLDAIFNRKVDLEALIKQAKQLKKDKK